MRQVTRIVSWGLMLVAAVCASADRADADAIRGYDRVVDLGQQEFLDVTLHPHFGPDGTVVAFKPPSGGSYHFDAILDPSSFGRTLTYTLQRDGAPTNLLPASLLGPGVNFSGPNAAGHVAGFLTRGDAASFYFDPQAGQVTWLGSLPGAVQKPQVYGINGSDQMVGEQDGKAIFYATPSSEPVELASLLPKDTGWKFYYASDINDRGEILGYGIDPSGLAADFKLEAAVPEPTALAMLALAGVVLVARSRARRHKRLTRIVSWGLMLVAALSTLAIRAEAEAIISYNKLIDVGQRSNGTLTEQPSIDESGHVTEIRPATAGDYTLGTVFDPYRYGVSVSQFLHRTGSDVNLLTPALQDSGAFVIVGLNASGHLVGSGRDGQPFYFSPETGQILQIKPLPGSIHGGSVFAINNLDQIVGESDGKATFYSSPTAEPVELSKMLSTASGWKLLQATGINDRGEIVGFGFSPASKESDFMLEPSPVPEPTALVAFALAGGVLATRSLAKRYGSPS